MNITTTFLIFPNGTVGKEFSYLGRFGRSSWFQYERNTGWWVVWVDEIELILSQRPRSLQSLLSLEQNCLVFPLGLLGLLSFSLGP